MPILEFYCPSCDSRFEKLVLGSLPPDFACPKCAGKEVRRVFSRFAATGGGTASGNGAGDSGAPAAGASGCSACASRNCAACH